MNKKFHFKILVYGDGVICEGQLRTIKIILRVWGTGKPVNTITVIIIQELLTSFSHARRVVLPVEETHHILVQWVLYMCHL